MVVLFLVAIVVMYGLRGDQYWDRLLFLFGALEALVFAGAGALFGTTVQRGNLEVARKDAEVARQDADQARQNAAQAQATMAEAQQEAARHREEASSSACRPVSQRQSARTDRPGARAEDLQPATTPSEMAQLVELANLWFPPRSG